MRHTVLLRALVLGLPLLLVLVVLGAHRFGPWLSTPLPDYGPAPAFALTDPWGRTVRADDLRGKVVLASFLYSACTDACPLLAPRLRDLQEALRRDGHLGTRALLLTFTVDPERDTPEVLRDYALRVGADPAGWRFLTGEPATVQRLIEEGFRLGVQRVPLAAGQRVRHVHADGTVHEHDYDTVVHSNRFVLIDREWRIRGYYDGLEVPLERLQHDIAALLR